MSALPDEPNHFLDWLRELHHLRSRARSPRRVYGDYLEALLHSSAKTSTAPIDLCATMSSTWTSATTATQCN